MPYSLEPIENDTILLVRYSNPATIDDFVGADADTCAFLDTVPEQMNVIADLSDLKSAPPPNTRLRQAGSFRHPKIGRLIMVGANSFIRTVINAMAQLAGSRRILFVATMEEALVVARQPLEVNAPRR